MVKACRLVKNAKQSGFDAVKFQIYRTENRFKKNNKTIKKILQKCELSEECFFKLKQYCDRIGIHFFATVFDEKDAVILQRLGCKICKISSFDITNQKLLKTLSTFPFQFYISTGMAAQKDIQKAKKIFQLKRKKTVFFHCVSSYPCDEKNVNLINIKHLKQITGGSVGFSDHSRDILAPALAVVLGANFIEKHFKLRNDHKCVDAAVSVDPPAARRMIALIRRAETMIGTKRIRQLACEKPSKKFQRITH